MENYSYLVGNSFVHKLIKESLALRKINQENIGKLPIFEETPSLPAEKQQNRIQFDCSFAPFNFFTSFVFFKSRSEAL